MWLKQMSLRQRRKSRAVVESEGGLRSRSVVNPRGVIHVGAGILIRHSAIAAVSGRIAKNESAAAGELLILAVTYQENAMTIPHSVSGAHAENPVVPGLHFGPAQAGANWPSGLQRFLDLAEVLFGQTRVRIPLLYPMELQAKR
jgi:hypothetical protein